MSSSILFISSAQPIPHTAAATQVSWEQTSCLLLQQQCHRHAISSSATVMPSSVIKHITWTVTVTMTITEQYSRQYSKLDYHDLRPRQHLITCLSVIQWRPSQTVKSLTVSGCWWAVTLCDSNLPACQLHQYSHYKHTLNIQHYQLPITTVVYKSRMLRVFTAKTTTVNSSPRPRPRLWDQDTAGWQS